MNAQLAIQAEDDEVLGIPDAQALGHAFDKRILDITSDTDLAPMVKLAFEGALGTADIEHLAEQMPRGNPASMKKEPLEFMRFQSKSKLAEWEYLAGQRFRYDFNLAHKSSTMVVNYAARALYATAAMMRQQSAGYHGKGASRHVSAYEIGHARIDAMQRRGAFASMNRTSFWLAEAVIGWELWPHEVAAYLGEDERYVSRRFKEALHDLAGFYRLHVTACARPRGINSAAGSNLGELNARERLQIEAGRANQGAGDPTPLENENPLSDQNGAFCPL